MICQEDVDGSEVLGVLDGRVVGSGRELDEFLVGRLAGVVEEIHVLGPVASVSGRSQRR